MNIRVSYFGQARHVTGVECEDIEVDTGATVSDVMRKVVEKHGEPLRNILLADDGALRKSVLIPVNDDATRGELLGALKDNDEVSIFPALSGG